MQEETALFSGEEGLRKFGLRFQESHQSPMQVALINDSWQLSAYYKCQKDKKLEPR